MGMYAVQSADSAELGEFRNAAHLGRSLSKERRRQLSQGQQAMYGGSAPDSAENLHGNGAGAVPSPNGQGPSNGSQRAPAATADTTNGVAAAHLGRALSKERRRQLSHGKQALTAGAGQTAAAAGLGAPPAADNRHGNGAGAAPTPDGQAASNGSQWAPGGTAGATDGVAAAHLGRALSKERRRQLSQGQQALTAGAGQTAAAAGLGAAPAAEATNGDRAVSVREQARARGAEANRFGGAGASRPQREGRVTHPPKVVVSPTQGRQRVTGLRIGPGVGVTGDEPGAALPVSGTQYLAADGSAPSMGSGPKVGLVRTPHGLVVSGTTVRNNVPITGDEAGEHLRITGEADQKFDDDLTPRRDGAYRSAQFPRRADPHGATAVGTRLVPHPGMGTSTGEGPWYPLENTDDGLAVTGTAVGRSGRVTGNEAGACRPITGDQYQILSSSSSECGGTGGGTAPAAHLNRARLDPVTAGKVTVAQTWRGQRVTGPSMEHRPNVTGDEPGSCRQLTGTPYQGPSTIFGWCEPDEGEPAAQRLDPRPKGVAVTGDLPMYAKGVTGIERGRRNDITGSSYYGDMRPAEPAADDGARWQAFSVPVALARRLAGGGGDDTATWETDKAAPPASNVPGRISGSFAVGDGMVTGNNEFLFRPRLNRNASQPVAVTGEGEIEGRTITGSAAAWTAHHLVTGTDGYIAAGRNPSEGGGGPHGWAGATRFKDLATPGSPGESANVTGRVGGSPKDGVRVTVSGGAQG